MPPLTQSSKKKRRTRDSESAERPKAPKLRRRTKPESTEGDKKKPTKVSEEVPIKIDTFDDDTSSTQDSLDRNISPVAGKWTIHDSSNQSSPSSSFRSLVCDGTLAIQDFILSAIERRGFTTPTPIQQYGIPSVLTGIDCLFKAPTGTGKTLAYGIPILSLLASCPSGPSSYVGIMPWRLNLSALIIVPSKELVDQVAKMLGTVSFYCTDLVQIWALPEWSSTSAPPNSKFNILVTQPGALYKLCQSIFLAFKRDSKLFAKSNTFDFFPNIRHLVIDEADLILSSYGFFAETSEFFQPNPEKWGGKSISIIPVGRISSQRAQVILCSATLNEELRELKRMALNKPGVVVVTDNPNDMKEPMLLDGNPAHLSLIRTSANDGLCRAHLSHYMVNVDRKKDEDMLYLYGLLKLNSTLKPKTLVFANTVLRAARLYLCLKKLAVDCTVVLSPQSLKSRLTAIKKFNQGIFSVLVACDTSFDNLDVEETGSKTDKTTKIARGLDFRGVSTVINFDAPGDRDDFIHRVGRAARGLSKSELEGNTVTFFTVKESGNSLIENMSMISLPGIDGSSYNQLRYRVEDTCRHVNSQFVNRFLSELSEAARAEKSGSTNPPSQIISTMKKLNPLFPTIPIYLRKS